VGSRGKQLETPQVHYHLDLHLIRSRTGVWEGFGEGFNDTEGEEKERETILFQQNQFISWVMGLGHGLGPTQLTFILCVHHVHTHT
jgi:hypothetical protein